MKILYHHRIASKDGQYVHVEELVNSLKLMGHELIIVEPAQLTSKPFGKSSGVTQSFRKFLPGFIHEFIEFCYSFFDFYFTVKAILKHRPDCIYERYNLFFVSGIWVKKIFSLPLILEINAPLFFERDKNHGIHLKFLAEWSEKYVWQNADYVLPVTAVLAEIVLASGVNRDQCVVVPNGINNQIFARDFDGDKIRTAYGLQNKLVLGFIGFVREWHKLDRVLDFLSEHRDRNWHLLLVGDGPVREALQQQAKALNIEDQVSFTGVIDHKQAPDYISAFDIALQPDVVEYASPLKLFEYMMLGKAILAPNRKNIVEILDDGDNALLFDPENEASFTRQLQYLCNNPQERLRLGQAARETIVTKQLFWNENAQKVTRLFSGLLSY